VNSALEDEMKRNPIFIITLIQSIFIFAILSNANAKFPDDPIAKFMEQIGLKEYNQLTTTFSPELKKYWEQSKISIDLKNIREEIDDTWEPEETSSMNWQTTNGVVIQKSFRLQHNFRSNYTLSFNSKEIDNSFKIISFNATAPYTSGAPIEVIETSKLYISKIQNEKFAEARNMVVPKFKEQITDDLYKTVRWLLITDKDKPAELKYEGYRTLYNGVWYDTVMVTPKKGFMQHLTLYLSLENEKYSIVTLEFKNPQKIN
jgi:hypothetical protein